MKVSRTLWFLLTAIAVFVGACGQPPHKYKSLPPPTLHNTPLKAPPPDCEHSMGGCLPQPKTIPKATTTSPVAYYRVRSAPRILGDDLSNNDAVPCSAFNAIAQGTRFVYLKSVEGVRFYDGTAFGMAVCAKVRHLPAGGYDFMHVCLVNPVDEAHKFVDALHTQVLLGGGTLPPAGDAEYPVSGHLSCSGRVWIQTWVDTVYASDGHICPILYTGAWWWQPAIGSWWPTCLGRQLLGWVSGYGVAYPYMPSGLNHLDIWQYTDHGFNGYSYGDLSVYLSGVEPFTQFVGGAPAKPNPYLIFPVHAFAIAGQHLSERSTVRAWDHARCRNPVRRGVCRRLRPQLLLERDRVWFVAHHTRDLKHPVKPPRWGVNHLGARFQGLYRRTRR